MSGLLEAGSEAQQLHTAIPEWLSSCGLSCCRILSRRPETQPPLCRMSRIGQVPGTGGRRAQMVMEVSLKMLVMTAVLNACAW